MPAYGGVDLGATNVRAVVGDERGRVLGRSKAETPRRSDGTAVTGAVLECLRQACATADVPPTELSGVGVGSIGPLDRRAGTVENPVNVPGADRIRLTRPIADLVDSDRVCLHNDTTAGVIGERFYGSETPDDVVYLTVSTGIGAGACVDGHVLGGWDGNAGEVGHTVVDPDGRMTCGCGVDGHWEAYCSGASIPRYAVSLHRNSDGDTRLPVGDGLEAADVFAHAGEDPLADRVLEGVARWNTVGVANLVHAYAPRTVAVGGAVALNNPGRVLDPVRETLEERVVSNVPELRLPTLGEDVVVCGALASVLPDGPASVSRE